MMNAKRSSGYNLTRYVFLVPAVVVLLLTFSLSKAEVAKHTFKTIATAIGNVAIVGNNENPVKRTVASTSTHTKPISVKALVKKVNTSADTIYAGKGKDGKKSFLLTSNKSLDSIGYVINGVRSSRADVSAIDPDRIYSVDMVSAKFAKEFIDDASGKSDFLFVTTEDSEKGMELKERINKSYRNGAIARAYNMSGTPTVVSSDIAPTTALRLTKAYSISSSTDVRTAVDVDTNGSKNISAVTVTGVAPKVKAKAMTYVKNTSVTPQTGGDVAITLDAPEAVNVTSSDKLTLADAKPPKLYITGFTGNNDQLTIDGEGHPLFVIDGKEVKSVNNLNPNDIKSITVLKDGTAEKKYGKKGKNGVIEITTKRK